jgi:hypothetical protein
MVDQRGVLRPQGAGCDIGAFELDPAGIGAGWQPPEKSIFKPNPGKDPSGAAQAEILVANPQSINTGFAFVPWAASPLFDDAPPDYIPPVDTAILTPTNGTLFDSYDPISVGGNAHADAFLKSLVLLIDGTEVYSTTYALEDEIIDAAWSAAFTPTADGVYFLAALAEDWAGNVQSVTRPVAISVAVTDPEITITTDTIAGVSEIAVPAQLAGTSSVPGSALVEVQVGAGAPFLPATYYAGAWTFPWNPDPAMDGVSISVTARITDPLGRTAIY